MVFQGPIPLSSIRPLTGWKTRDFPFRGKTCMVIGNGEMGKVTALALKEAGADVTVTVRQYRSGIVTIPQGCERINYGDRMELLPKCDLVVSATASPNCTITKELFENAEVPPSCDTDRPGCAKRY